MANHAELLPLLQLPHTFAELCQKHLADGEYEPEILNRVNAYLLFIELVEQDHIRIDLSAVGEAPAEGFYIKDIPELLHPAFEEFFDTNEPSEWLFEDENGYEMDEINIIGEVIPNLPSQTSYNPQNLQRLKDALKGGIDEFTGLELLERFFPNEEAEETPIKQTVWRALPKKKRTMIDELRTLISIDLE